MTELDHQQVSSEAALLMERLLELDPADERYMIIKATLDYKASWLSLAEHLDTVAANKSYKEWGYKSFKDYCATEIQIPQSTVKKLVRGFQWIDQEAPDVLKRFVKAMQEDGEALGQDEELPIQPIPEFDMVQVLVSAQKEREKARLSEDVYESIKQQALTGEKSARELKKDIKEALPVEQVEPKVKQLKVLRKTLSTTERVIAQLEELEEADEQVMQLLGQLRDRVFDLVSAMLDEQAYQAPEGEAEA